MSAAEIPVEVRDAVAEDMQAVTDIVNHYIKTSWVNFRTQPQTSAEWTSDWERYRQRYPWLVAKHRERVVGIAYAAPFKLREAYDWCAEVTVYVSHETSRCGVGKELYQRLIPTLQEQGFHSVIALIALPNPPSVALHEAFGLQHSGTLRHVGFKLGEWHDIGFWQRILVAEDDAPSPTRQPSSQTP